jgi:hypothetical protein
MIIGPLVMFIERVWIVTTKMGATFLYTVSLH